MDSECLEMVSDSSEMDSDSSEMDFECSEIILALFFCGLSWPESALGRSQGWFSLQSPNAMRHGRKNFWNFADLD